MKLKFNSNQQHQTDAIQAIIEVFEGQGLNKGNFEVSFGTGGGSIEFTDKGVGNKIELAPEQLLKNIQKVQTDYLSTPEKPYMPDTDLKTLQFKDKDDKTKSVAIPNLTIEMETGTGKTYTYLRTIYELNKVYGFLKFVIVVPSVAIREGTLKNLEVTHEHFQTLYNKPSINYTLYDRKNLPALSNFAISSNIQVLVINIDSFTKDGNVINQIRETGIKPIEYIQSTHPFVIIDEPQNMETDIRKRAIANLHPSCTFRYSATHRDFYNLIYKLDPVQAYDLGLVKQIEVDGITVEDNDSAAFIQFEDIKRQKRSVKARLKININGANGVIKKAFNCDVGTDLYKLSNGRDVYKNRFIINSIDAEWGEVEFANGLTISKGQTQGGLTDEVMKFQMERTIKRHFDKERRYQAKGIKVLSLFFIDKVANYRTYNQDNTADKGKFAMWFEELFAKYAAMPKYQDLYPFKPSEVHNGYFSQDKKGKLKDTKGNTKQDDTTYNLIMKHKERLLDVNEPLRFIFSHTALREGWDNPNVFQICTLNETKSDVKKRQEIGRGLRLPVDSSGQRSFDKRINILTVIANETYKDFSEQLQKEIQEETSVDFKGRIKDSNKKAQIKLTKELTPENSPDFFELWDKIKQRTRYRVAYKTEDLIREAAKAIKEMPSTSRPMLKSETGRLAFTDTGIEASTMASERQIDYNSKYAIPDVYGYIQSRVDITRPVIYEILKQSNKINELEINPQMFLDNVVSRIRATLHKLMIEKEGLKYEKIEGQFYEMRLFKNEEIETYLSSLFEVTKTDKTLYNYVPIDSGTENKFAADCETDENIKFYFKLPRGFKIPTPLGNYNPDWAVIFENSQRIYFVAETKSSTSPEKRRVQENLKILCGKAHFALFENDGVRYKVVDSVKGLYQ